MEIRKLTAQDVSKLVNLVAQAQNLHAKQQPERYNLITDIASLKSIVLKNIEQTGAICLGVIISDEIVGYLMAVLATTSDHVQFKTRKVLNLNEICVHPNHHRKGIADRLMETIIEEGRKQGATAIKASHASFNLASESLMKKHGLIPKMTSCELQLHK